MKHIGIIAEYNPFHNGHAYQLQKAKERYPDKKIIVIMSGNYVQRGEPAIFNKYVRAQCALYDQADIVFELPLLHATASAEYFAQAAVNALNKLGVIDTLCFGAETDNLPLLQKIAQVLTEEPADYKTTLQQELRNGNSFPKARMLALQTSIRDFDIEIILQQPNNILAIEYLKALQSRNADIQPVIIQRIGSGYHDKSTTNMYSSATAIRNEIKQNQGKLDNLIPKVSLNLLKHSDYAKPLYTSDFYVYLQYALWHEYNYLESYLDVSEDIANMLRSITSYPETLEELISVLSNKQYTTTRIQRALLHILLNIKHTDMEHSKNNEYISYLRLLGFKKNASSILKDAKETSKVPIINKVADAKNILSSEALSLFKKEIRQNHLYRQIFLNKYGIQIPSEYEHSVIISE